MGIDRLWAPWRLAYVSGQEQTKPSGGPQASPQGEAAPQGQGSPAGHAPCFICRGLAESADRDNLIVERTAGTVTLLNRYPYNNGHLLVAPRAHKARLDELTAAEHAELMAVVTRMTGLLERLMKAEGFNVGLNLGRPAGAGLPGHLHWHIVPRWNGDTNFMPTLAATRVIPQALDALWEMLTQALAAPSTSPPAP